MTSETVPQWICQSLWRLESPSSLSRVQMSPAWWAVQKKTDFHTNDLCFPSIMRLSSCSTRLGRTLVLPIWRRAGCPCYNFLTWDMWVFRLFRAPHLRALSHQARIWKPDIFLIKHGTFQVLLRLSVCLQNLDQMKIRQMSQPISTAPFLAMK